VVGPIDVLVSGQGQVDVVASLNINESNEVHYDLTHAFFHTGLGIATRKAGGDSVWSTLAQLATGRALLALAGLIALLLGAGVLMWLIERQQNPDEFGGRDGWLQGLFCSVVSPRTWRRR
jgi:polar amino acid transport system substrate-binding protein